jgi:hypothetical protein
MDMALVSVHSDGTDKFYVMYNLYIMNIHQALNQQSASDFARAQIYLTRQQNADLQLVGRQTSASKSELIRLAIDRFLAITKEQPVMDKTPKLLKLAGLWADRAELVDPTAYVKSLRQPRF